MPLRAAACRRLPMNPLSEGDMRNTTMWMLPIVSLALILVAPLASGLVAEQRDRLLKTKACEGCDLSGLTLSHAVLNGARLAGANLRGASLQYAALKMADFTGADLTDADLSNAFIRPGTFRRANLSGAKLVGARLPNADLTEANLTEADLRGAILYGADFRGADLSRARLVGALLSSEGQGIGDVIVAARFEGARLDGATWVDGNVCKAGSVGQCLR